jgi:hypothetical protein
VWTNLHFEEFWAWSEFVMREEPDTLAQLEVNLPKK